MAKCYFVGGPNGSGKTTIVNGAIAEGPWSRALNLNADQISRERRRYLPFVPKPLFDYYAAQVVQDRVDQAIVANQDFIVETVLSSDKFFSRLAAATKGGFSTKFAFVFVSDIAQSLERIDDRVKRLRQHRVPPDKVRKRWPRSLARAPYFFAIAEDAVLFDNSGDDARPIVVKSPAGMRVYVDEGWINARPKQIQDMIKACVTPPPWLTQQISAWRRSECSEQEQAALISAISTALRN